jgi:hypothetical protein
MPSCSQERMHSRADPSLSRASSAARSLSELATPGMLSRVMAGQAELTAAVNSTTVSMDARANVALAARHEAELLQEATKESSALFEQRRRRRAADAAARLAAQARASPRSRLLSASSPKTPRSPPFPDAGCSSEDAGLLANPMGASSPTARVAIAHSSPRRDIIQRNVGNIRAIEDLMGVARKWERSGVRDLSEPSSPLALPPPGPGRVRPPAATASKLPFLRPLPTAFTATQPLTTVVNDAPAIVVVDSASSAASPHDRVVTPAPDRNAGSSSRALLTLPLPVLVSEPGSPALQPSGAGSAASLRVPLATYPAITGTPLTPYAVSSSEVEPATFTARNDKGSNIQAVRDRRNETMRQQRERAAHANDARHQHFAENTRAIATLNETVLRIASWMVTVQVVRAFKKMDDQSTAIIRHERESRRRRALFVLAYRIPHLYRMFRRRKRVRALRRAAAVMLAVVRFKRGLKVAAARILRATLAAQRADPRSTFRMYVRTLRAITRLSSKKALIRRSHFGLLARQWDAMELYLMLTRPELVLSAAELRGVRGLRRLDDDTAALLRRTVHSRGASPANSTRPSPAVKNLDAAVNLTVPNATPAPEAPAATSVVSSRHSSKLASPVTLALAVPAPAAAGPVVPTTSPFVTNPDFARYTLVPEELRAMAYDPEVPYFEFLRSYKRYCKKQWCPLLPAEFSSPELHVLPAIRVRELQQFTRSWFRKQNRAIRTAFSTHFSSRQSTMDLLSSAMRTRREEASKRTKERYPFLGANSGIYKALVDIETHSSAASPLVQALLDQCTNVLAKPLPMPPRHGVLMSREDLQTTVEQALNHSKLVRLLRLTGTDMPTGFEA